MYSPDGRLSIAEFSIFFHSFFNLFCYHCYKLGTISNASPQGSSPDGERPDEEMNDENKPAGEMPDGEKPAGEKPDGEKPDGEMPPQMSGASPTFTESDETITIDISDASITKDSQTIGADDITEGDILQVTLLDNNKVDTVIVITFPGSGAADTSTPVSQGSCANTITEDGTYTDQTYSSTGDDENALRIDGADVLLDSITVDKSAGATSNTESGDFYGMNAALLATDGADVTIKNATIHSAAQNGNGVFSYGSNTTVTISNSEITTTADNSGGIQTTGGGTVNADGGTYTSNGYNSPAVYSTASISVANAVLTAGNSEALVIEGKNSISLKDCTVYGNMSDTLGTSSDENVHNVMIYQSMSSDADVGTSNFSMTGGSLTSNNGDMFYITNTACNITLSDVSIVNKTSGGYLMNICGNSGSHGWGTAGENGAQVVFTANSQNLSGDIVVDTISTLNMTLKGNSSFSGIVNIVENTANGTTDNAHAVITIESGSVWELTGDCTITSLTNNGTIRFNGYSITLADGTVLE